MDVDKMHEVCALTGAESVSVGVELDPATGKYYSGCTLSYAGGKKLHIIVAQITEPTEPTLALEHP